MFDFKSFTDNIATALNALTPKVTIPFAATGWLLLYVSASGRMPLPATVTVAALVVAILCTCLAISGSILAAWTVAMPVRQNVRRHFWLRGERRRIEAELPHLQARERQILGCLLAQNQRAIELQPDGEEATILIAKGFLVLPARRPLAVHRDVVFELPDYVWEVLTEHRDAFPFDPATEPANPWRTHWMNR